MVVDPADLGCIVRFVFLKISCWKPVHKVGYKDNDGRSSPGIVGVDLEPLLAGAEGKDGDEGATHVKADDIHTKEGD